MTTLLRDLASRRLVLTAVLGLLVATAVVVSPATTRHAAAYVGPGSACYGSGCNGKDPNAMGCSHDARNLDEFTYRGSQGPRVVLRYSPGCGAMWARLYNPFGSEFGYNWMVLYAWTAPSGGSMIVSVPTWAGGATNAWTNMWTAANWDQACLSNTWGPPPS